MWENFFKHVDVLPENVRRAVISTRLNLLPKQTVSSKSFESPLIGALRCTFWTETQATVNPHRFRRSAGGIAHAPLCMLTPRFLHCTAATSSASNPTAA
jgi:hypothetical protein